ncbi:uncharacterized protein JCM15063_005792 [Sporobolomyces koalae]|uniref:uncharacterized protein n=1 Tax=Sporobolomyces koalae TaxID=500713 RepID=UPI0031773623
MLKRILEDQYKPLRIKGFTKAIPKPAPLPAQLFTTLPTSSSVDASSSTEYRSKHPWEYDLTFKPPEHYHPAPGYRPAPSAATLHSKAARGQIIKKKLVGATDTSTHAGKREQARKVRIFDAYEKTFDYRGGHRTHALDRGSTTTLGHDTAARTPIEDGSRDAEGTYMAGQMRVYEGFIEEKIKKAREQGLFKNVKGRGKPIPRDEEEGNPFISRDDFLINRILKTQDAAPPWIELQKELEQSLSSFRSTLASSWTRRAIRIRSSEGLTRSVIVEIEQGWRDREWERTESKYHETAVKEVNDLTRRFNIIAPYHVRRPLLNLESELVRTITQSAPPIAQELSKRLSLGLHTTPSSLPILPTEEEDGARNLTAEEMGGERKAVKESMWKAFRRVVVEVLGQTPDQTPRAPNS